MSVPVLCATHQPRSGSRWANGSNPKTPAAMDMSVSRFSQQSTLVLTSALTTAPRCSRASRPDSSIAEPVDNVAGSVGPRKSRTRSCSRVAARSSWTARAVTEGRPTVRSNTFVARLSLTAPTSAARSGAGNAGTERCCQRPESATVSAVERGIATDESRSPLTSRRATSISSNTLPIDAVGRIRSASSDTSTTPVSASITLTDRLSRVARESWSGITCQWSQGTGACR